MVSERSQDGRKGSVIYIQRKILNLMFDSQKTYTLLGRRTQNLEESHTQAPHLLTK